MQWSKPEYQEVSLNMEVTAYVNTDENRDENLPRREEAKPAPANAATA